MLIDAASPKMSTNLLDRPINRKNPNGFPKSVHFHVVDGNDPGYFRSPLRADIPYSVIMRIQNAERRESQRLFSDCRTINDGAKVFPTVSFPPPELHLLDREMVCRTCVYGNSRNQDR